MNKSLKKLQHFPWNPSPSFPKIIPYQKTFQNSNKKDKISLFSLEYKKNGKPYISPSIKKSMNSYTSQKIQRFGYLPLNGDENFTKKSAELILSKKTNLSDFDDFVINQSLGSSGGILLSFYLLKNIYKSNKIYFPNKSNIFQSNLAENLGFDVSFFNFFDFDKNFLDFEKCCFDLKKIENGSIVFFEPINHSSGFTFENWQWEEIAKISKKNNFVVILNLPNFGFYKGSFSEDSEIINFFLDENIQLLISNGLSSSFSLYGHRLGSFLMMNQEKKKVPLIKDMLAHITRNTYNFYPRYSSDIANTVFNNENLFSELKKNLLENVEDLNMKKKALFKFLFKENYDFWKFMENQNGLFLYTGLNEKQILDLREKFGIFILNCGKLNISELEFSNIEYVAKSFNSVIRS